METGKKVVIGGAVIGVFLLGVVVGWKMNDWRLQRLRNKRDYYLERAHQLHDQIES